MWKKAIGQSLFHLYLDGEDTTACGKSPMFDGREKTSNARPNDKVCDEYLIKEKE